ncbi:iron chaperone [Tessaracoccus lacteus]|uniref:DUF1801 domain-containing protein n=1 Tax=Tessaracoccus lacteus TaxID=3041766 RepID=A0ABY8PV99_9ACTN|nr:DUF1801 domain-containing protein [Tessaracoccus sp. T21]WGT46378.1 DUF1801 domain-containing protein [Tessaracoccus sp. T21]
MAEKAGAEFSADEKAAMKSRAAELRAEKAAQRAADKAAALEQVCLDAIAAMPDDDRAIAERLHALVKENAPKLGSKTWYGFPAYTDDAGQVVLFFQPRVKFGARYSTLGFNDSAALDDGPMWPVYFAIDHLEQADEVRIAELIRRAVGTA